MVTVKDVARLAGVSPMTVSRVVNGNAQVNAEMRDRVLLSIAELGYVRNASASRLRAPSAPGYTLGLILRDVSNPFSAEMQRAVEDFLRQSGSLVLMASNDDDTNLTRQLTEVMQRFRVDGLIVAPPPGDQGYLSALVERGFPVVLVDRPSAGVDVPFVISDNFEAIKGAVLHLSSFGHKHIAFLGDERSAPMEARRDGFRAGLVECKISPDEAFERLDASTMEEATAITSHLLTVASPPTAFIGGRNAVSIGILRALRAAGKQHRVALVSFDDIELAAELDPGLTAIAQDPTTIGQRAARLVLEMIQTNGPRSPGESIVVPTHLIARGSGEIPAPQTPQGVV